MERQDYTIAEIVATLGIPERSLRHWIHKGLRHERRGRMIFIQKGDLESFMRKHIKTNTTYHYVEEEKELATCE